MITVEASRAKFSPMARHLRRVLAGVLPRLTKRPVQVSVFLISDAEMKALNTRTRGKDMTTNVLSFDAADNLPHPELPAKTRMLGEVFLAPDTIARKKEDMELLVIHGLLHLFGYTHARVRDRIEMEKKEDELYGIYRNRIGRRLKHGTRRGGRRTA